MDRDCAVVTGASSGIGAATALKLAERGVTVVAAARGPEKLTRHGRFPKLAKRLDLIRADLTQPADVDRVFSHAEATHGPVGHVVHSVGFAYRVDWYRASTPQEVLAAVASLVTSPALVLNRALQSMRGRGGKVGLISSGAAARPTPGRALYSSSKVAVNRLVESVAAECDADASGTAVFAVLPGRVDTPAQRRLMEEATHADPAFRLDRFRSDRDVWPADVVGEAIACLLERGSTDLNGQVFRYSPDGWLNPDR